MLSEPIAVTLQVIEVLEALDVPYLIGGSFAAAVYGVARMTVDVDLVADVRFEHVDPLTRRLSPDFYLDSGSMREAIRQRSSFSLIHFKTMFKVDVFIPKQRPYSQQQMERRVRQPLSTETDQLAYFSSAEDSVLSKLEWYRLGGEVSERQWRDILGVIKTQSERLDLAYLRQWAAALNVAALLERRCLKRSDLASYTEFVGAAAKALTSRDITGGSTSRFTGGADVDK
jgi:hypothetical protein